MFFNSFLFSNYPQCHLHATSRESACRAGRQLLLQVSSFLHSSELLFSQLQQPKKEETLKNTKSYFQALIPPPRAHHGARGGGRRRAPAPGHRLRQLRPQPRPSPPRPTPPPPPPSPPTYPTNPPHSPPSSSPHLFRSNRCHQLEQASAALHQHSPASPPFILPFSG